MNVVGPGAGFDFRKVEPKRTTPQSESAAQRQTEAQVRLSLTNIGGGGKLSAVVTTDLKGSDFSAGSIESKAADGAAETGNDESVSENAAEWPDDPGDLANDGELVDERLTDEEESTEEQRQSQGQRLDVLETSYRSRFMVLDRLCDCLIATDNVLTEWLDERSNKL
jgi:hypothetical protein